MPSTKMRHHPIFIIDEDNDNVLDINVENIKKLILEQLIEDGLVDSESCRAFTVPRGYSQNDHQLLLTSIIDDAQYYSLAGPGKHEITKKHSMDLIKKSLASEGDFSMRAMESEAKARIPR